MKYLLKEEGVLDTLSKEQTVSLAAYLADQKSEVTEDETTQLGDVAS